MVIFPELFIGGLSTDIREAKSRIFAEQATNRLAEVCKSLKIHCIFGAPHLQNGELLNAVFSAQPDGEIRYLCNKAFLYSNFEKVTFATRPSHRVHNINGKKIAILICYEVNFPQIFDKLFKTHRDIDVIIVPTASSRHFDYVPEVIVRSRAIEFGVPVIFVNQVGKVGDIDFGGKSCVAWPDGKYTLLSGLCEELHSFTFKKNENLPKIPYINGEDYESIEYKINLIS
nr:carbon-nitrogen hydrolase family protein [Roseibium sediminis]